MKKKIDDVGVHVPYAKKDLHQGASSTGSFDVTKKVLWPEPDWVKLSFGLPKDVLVFMFVVYGSIRFRPRHECGGVSREAWLSAYIESVKLLRCLFESCKTVDDMYLLESRFHEHFGYRKSRSFQVKRDYCVFAAGGGAKRALRTPFNLSMRMSLLRNTLANVDWPLIAASDVREYAAKIRLNGDLVWVVCRIENGSLLLLDFKGNRYDTAAEAAAVVSKRLSSRGSGVYRPSKDLSGLRNERVVPRVEAEMLLRDFGFRAVQFGNTVSQKDRQLFLDNVYLCFEVLGRLMGVPSRWLGLGGVALAYGARGQPGASAHFEPELNVINLTKRNGASSVGHEFFHAIDARLAKSMGLSSGLLSEQLSVVGFIDDEVKQSKLNALRELVGFIEQTNFYKQSLRLTEQKGGALYWSKRSELLARGFESSLELWMKEVGERCDWLAYGTIDCAQGANVALMHPYPLGDERFALLGAYRRFFGVLWSK